MRCPGLCWGIASLCLMDAWGRPMSIGMGSIFPRRVFDGVATQKTCSVLIFIRGPPTTNHQRVVVTRGAGTEKPRLFVNKAPSPTYLSTWKLTSAWPNDIKQ